MKKLFLLAIGAVISLSLMQNYIRLVTLSSDLWVKNADCQNFLHKSVKKLDTFM